MRYLRIQAMILLWFPGLLHYTVSSYINFVKNLGKLRTHNLISFKKLASLLSPEEELELKKNNCTNEANKDLRKTNNNKGRKNRIGTNSLQKDQFQEKGFEDL